MLKRILGPKRNDVTNECIRLHNKELHEVLLIKYNSGDQIKKTEMDRACSTYGEMRQIQDLMQKSEGRRPLERSKRRWKDNIKIYLTKVE
jgi:hypothetical protein